MDTIAKDHSYRTLAAHGIADGLSEGLMGNSEVGWVVLCACDVIRWRTDAIGPGAGT